MSEVRMNGESWKLTDDGYCAHCQAYRAMWLGDCFNPVHFMSEKDIEPYIYEDQP